MNLRTPRGETAEIILQLKRAPVVVTMGVFAANSPCLARMKVGTHSCLVTKENVRLMLARQSTNLRKLLFTHFSTRSWSC